MLDIGSSEVDNSTLQGQQQVNTTEETATANEDGHVPESAAQAEHTDEVTT
jgi:hypothetical protein